MPGAIPKRVLVVDDNELLLKAWRRILEKEDCVPLLTSNPEEAIRWHQDQPADVIISDIVMPYMDGIELIQKLQELTPEVRIILTTGYSCDFSRIRLHIRSSDVHVLLKPYNDLNAIKKFLDRVFHDDDSLDSEDSFKNPDDIKIHLWNL